MKSRTILQMVALSVLSLFLCLSDSTGALCEAPSEFVAAGKDGYLFYTRQDDGDPVGCYQGTNLYSREELQAFKDNCMAQTDVLRQEGMELIILIVPDKGRIYSEYMPDQYGLPPEEYRALQVYRCLKEETDLIVVYPYDELMQAKASLGVPLFNKTDTHWNAVGAYVGSAALLRETGNSLPDLSDEGITVIKGEPVAGDLAEMLGLTGKPDFDYVVQGYDTHGMEALAWEFTGVFVFHSYDSDPRKVYVIRDSFASHLAPYVGSRFQDTYWRHISTYTWEDLADQNPDIVIYETAERYLDHLKTFSFR